MKTQHEEDATALPSVLRFDAVGLNYKTRSGTTTALEGLNIDIAEAEFVSVLGPSGCGKSTLMKIASGLLPTTSGSAKLSGQVITGPNPEVGVVFQQPTLLQWKTVLENVLMPIRSLGLPQKQYRSRAMQLLDLVNLSDFANNYPYELSGGMRQRVGIARGLVHDPKVLLMDEPFAALDAMTRETMMGELQRIWMETRKSVLFITHSIPEAVFLSDRVVTLSQRPGRVIDDLRIDLPRPRQLQDMTSAEFGAHSARLRQLFVDMAKSADPQEATA